MQLKIYQISHPIIKIILNRINTQYISETEKEHYDRYIGFLVIYEALRSYIIVKNLYIKIVEGVKKTQLIDKNKEYIILTNTSNTYNMITDIKSIISSLKIIHIDYDNIEKIEKCIKRLDIEIEKASIFIIEKVTEDENIINLLHYLSSMKKVSLNQISIANILSNSIVLNKISQKYPQLRVYTTTIKEIIE